MRVLCRHGHFAFYPKRLSDITRFTSFFKEDLVRVDDYYTFENLAEAENYSILGKPYVNLPALTTYEGKPWEVMRENGFVYHVASGLLVPKLSILIPVNPPQAGYYFLAQTPIIQPGSRNLSLQQILSYDGEFHQDTFRLRVSSYQYE